MLDGIGVLQNVQVYSVTKMSSKCLIMIAHIMLVFYVYNHDEAF